jgi:hypothetical protein
MYYEDWAGAPEPSVKEAGTTGIQRYVMAQAPLTTADALTMPSRIRTRTAWLSIANSGARNALGGFRF